MLGDDDSVAKGLYKSIRSYKFIVFTHFLCDILSALAYLSRFFQQDNLDFSEVENAVEATISDVKETYLSSNGKLGGEHLLEHLKNPLIFEDHQPIKNPSDEQVLVSVCLLKQLYAILRKDSQNYQYGLPFLTPLHTLRRLHNYEDSETRYLPVILVKGNSRNGV